MNISDLCETIYFATIKPEQPEYLEHPEQPF